jgi:hypothetical protein
MSTTATAHRFSRPTLLGRATRAAIRQRDVLLALVLYTGYALFLTWPLVIHLGSDIAGTSVNGDLGGGIAQLQYGVDHHVFPFAPGVLHGLDAPQGAQLAWVQNWASFPSIALLWTLGYAFGAGAANSLYLLLGFVLSGISMFLLARRVSGNASAAVLAGFAFAFFPWAVDKINGHVDYMHGWVLVVIAWRMLLLAERPTLRNGLIAGCATAFAMWWTPYFILIGGVAWGALALTAVIVSSLRGRGRATVKAAAVSVVPIAVVFGSLGLLTKLAGGVNTGSVRVHTIGELYAFSARWLEWLLPDRNNLIFGGATGPYLTSHLHGSNFSESSLYLGDSVLALALLAIVLAVRRLWRERMAALDDPRVFAAVAATVVALAAAWFSSPPKVRLVGIWVPTPSWFIYHVTSTWRVYTRFVELIELGLCLLMALAIAWMLSHCRSPVRPALLAGLVAVLVLDLWARPPVRTIAVTPPPPEYTWLREHPGGIVVDYPIEMAVVPDYSMLFWANTHRHPLFQGYAANSDDETFKQDFVDVEEPSTAPGLAGLGVRYIVVHPGLPDATPAVMRRDGYALRYSSPDGSTVWQVVAHPASTRVDMLENFSYVQGAPGAESRWMTGPGLLALHALKCDTACSGTLTFASSSADIPRSLSVRDERTGRVLLRKTIPRSTAVPVSIPGIELVRGQARLLLTTDPGPRQPLNGDPRSLSVTVGEPHLRLTGG